MIFSNIKSDTPIKAKNNVSASKLINSLKNFLLDILISLLSFSTLSLLQYIYIVLTKMYDSFYNQSL